MLKYEPEGEQAKESGTVEAPVLHTNAVVNGYYTKDQVDNDKNRELTTDVISADVTLNLPTGEPELYYYRLQSKDGGLPSDNGNIVTNLQQRTDGTYREMLNTSPLYVEDQNFSYPAGELHYFNDKDEPIVSTADVKYVTYAPTVTTWGIHRRYYEDDGLDNTYGAPIWKTGAGEVKMSQDNNIVERQNKSQWTQWTADGEGCCLYRLHVDAQGYLPSADISNVEYEPYMFRIWAQCDDGFRNWEFGPNGYPIDKGEFNDEVTGKKLMWLKDIPVQAQENVDYYTLNFGETGQNTQGYDPADQLVFGAKNTATPTIIVRFYYKTKDNTTTSGLRGEGDGKGYNGSEGSIAPQPKTAVYELHNDGEVVSKTYINTQGMKSDKPFDGVNIVVTRYSDGSTVTTKEVKY